MSESKKSSPLVAFTIGAMAVVFATSLFLGILYLRGRMTNNPAPITGVQTGQTAIDNKTVIFNIYPDEAVVLMPLNDASAIGEGGANPTPAPIQPTAIPPTPIPSTPTPVPAPEKIIFTSYTVQNGDNLYNIAAHFGWRSTISLMAKYNIAADHIVPGAVLTPFPVANPDYCPGRQPYVVEENESAYTISQTVGTTLETLKEINNLDDQYTVYVTDVICVP